LPVSILTALTAGALFLAAGAANARDLDVAMQQYVIASCSDDAFRLCPQALGNQNDAVACMKSKRSQLNQTCRVAYDKVVRTLRR
jgi:hypothetical protein